MPLGIAFCDVRLTVTPGICKTTTLPKPAEPFTQKGLTSIPTPSVLMMWNDALTILLVLDHKGSMNILRLLGL